MPSNQIDYANEIQALWKQPYERVNQATRDGHEIKGDLFVETMRRILPEPAVNEPPPTHLYEPLRRLLREAIADIDRRYSRGREW